MKTTAFLSALLLAAVCLAAAAAPAAAEQSALVPAEAQEPAMTTPAAEPIMTTPATPELTEPEFYGFAAETPEITLNVGETCQLKAVWDADCYYVESLQFASDNSQAASVTRDGLVTANAEGTAIIRITAKLNPDTVTLSPQDTPVRTVTATVTVIDNTLTAEQKAALKQLTQKENRLIGEFRRERAVIKGILAEDAPRFTPDAVSGIIGNADSFDAAMQALAAEQAYPDYFGGSGLTLIEYWFDNAGTEKILAVAEQEEILYIRLDTDGSTLEWHYLYPAAQQDTQSFRTGLANITYKAFNSIPADGDADCSGKTDVADAVLVARFAAEDREAVITDQGRLNADISGDGNVTTDDTELILKKIAKKDLISDSLNSRRY